MNNNLQTIIVIGANMRAVVQVDTDLCGDPYVEAATRAFEVVFRAKDDPSVELRPIDESVDIGIGLIVTAHTPETEGDIDKHMLMSSRNVAENAGLLEVVKHFDDGEARLKNRGK